MNKKTMMFFWVVFAVFIVTKYGCNQTAPQRVNTTENTVLLELHNEQRVSKELESLILDEQLCEYAQKHAEHMAQKNDLVHSSISDLQDFSGAGIVGENIAWGQESEKSVVNAWMRSYGHRKNILGSRYQKVGFGSAKDSKGRIYWCAVFAGG